MYTVQRKVLKSRRALPTELVESIESSEKSSNYRGTVVHSLLPKMGTIKQFPSENIGLRRRPASSPTQESYGSYGHNAEISTSSADGGNKTRGAIFIDIRSCLFFRRRFGKTFVAALALILFFVTLKRLLRMTGRRAVRSSSLKLHPQIICVRPGPPLYSFVSCPPMREHAVNEYVDADNDGIGEYHPIHSTQKLNQNREQNDDDDDAYPFVDTDPTTTKDTCRTPGKWHKVPHPNCNAFHERLDSVSDIVVLNNGQTTQVFELRHLDGSGDSILEEDRWVFKLKRFDKDVSEKIEEASILSQLSSSPYIPDIYGFCATSTLNPLASSGTLYDLIKSIRKGGEDLLDKSVDTLRICVQVSSGLAALHDANGDGRPAFAHNDLDITQYIYNDKLQVYQLNDFGHGHFIKYDANKKECKIARSGMGGWKYRSPEDLRAHKERRPPFYVDKSDVYSLGVALYMVLTRLWLWEDERRSVSAERIMRGEKPPIPDGLLQSSDPAIQAVIKAIEMCWVFDPEKRPSSGSVAHFLQTEFEKIRPGEEMKVSLPLLLDSIVELDDDYDGKM